MHSAIRFSRYFHRCLSFVLSMLLTVAPSAYGARLQLSKDYNIRMALMDGKEVVRVGLLKAGSVLEIPDQFVVGKGSDGVTEGTPDFDATLNNWLTNGGVLSRDLKPIEQENDKKEPEVFFPVKIIRAAAGSVVSPALYEHPVYVALGNIAANGHGFLLNQDLEVVDNLATQAHRTQAVAECSDCDEPAIIALTSALYLATTLIQNGTERKERQFKQNGTTIRKNFEDRCGITFEEYEKQLAEMTADEPLFRELMKSLIASESAGVHLCKAKNITDRDGGSWGLFQINAGSSSNSSCKKIGEMSKQSLVSLDRAISGNRTLPSELTAYIEDYRVCRAYLSDPINNTKEALRILRQKQVALFEARDAPFNRIVMSQVDRLRALLSAYNGGEHWLKIAKKDLLRFNQRHGTRLDHNKWTDLRLFFLRAFLGGDQRQAFLGEWRSSRHARLARTNLVYTENLIPLDRGELRTLSGFIAIGNGLRNIARN